MAQKTKSKASSKKAKQTESDFFAEITENVTLDLYERKRGKVNAKITLCDAFVIYAKVIEGKNGYFLSYPNFKTKDGEYINQAYCFDRDVIEMINDALESYFEGN